MEQRRSAGHDHWFYESQTSPSAKQAAPLVPESAHIDDRFLLGLREEAGERLSLLDAQKPALLAAQAIGRLLFPDSITPTLTHTLTLYDRLCTALTVAQVAGVQRLCNHYSARLNPLPGPDSSRQSNNRLTQITQYARQLAMQPELINASALKALDAVGLTEPDIVTLNQVVGFVCYQSRVVAGLHALLALPVRWLPGVIPAPDADETGFGVKHRWQPAVSPVELRYASATQIAAVTFCQRQPELDEAVWLLAHDAGVLFRWQSLRQRIASGPHAQLAEAAAARVLGSRWAFQWFTPAIRDRLLVSPEEAAAGISEQERIITLSAQLTRSPERFSAAHLQPLINAGWQPEALFNLVQATAIGNWNSRLFYALGETE